MMDETALNIFTDGSSYPSPRAGGAGARFVFVDPLGKEIVEDFPFIGYSGATNNQMELQACIDSLKEVLRRKDIDQFSRIIIISDSAYVVENYKTAKYQWSNPWLENKWETAAGTPVLNAEQWKELLKQAKKIYEKFHKNVEFKWTKGHSKSEHNKAADKLAEKSAKTPSSRKLSFVKVRRKKFGNQSVNIGSVKMLGQRMSIYIITEQYLRVQRTSRYRYQVLSRSSPYFKCIDFACSKEILSAGHSYSVRFNTDSKNPQIIKKFHEILKPSPKTTDKSCSKKV